MSDQDKLSKIEKDVSVIRRWWPAIAAIFAAGLFVIKITSSVQRTYDNDVAKKEDITTVSKQLSDLKTQLIVFQTNFTQMKAAHISDSLERAAIRYDLQKQTKLYRSVLAELTRGGYITERWVNGQLVKTHVK